MWPRLVANKLLRNPSKTKNFVADFPNIKTCSVYPSHAEQKEILEYKLFASTYNVGGVAPSDDLKLEEWLDAENSSYDIYVLGFQEVVPLTAKNVLGAENSRASAKWSSLIRAALNRSARDSREPDHHRVYPSDGSAEQGGYRCVASKKMVGISVSVWVRSGLVRFVRHTSFSCVGCGFMGCLGNKVMIDPSFNNNLIVKK